MPVTVVDLFEPYGPLEEDFFPEAGDANAGEDPLSVALIARMESYLERAVAKVAGYAGAAVVDEDAAVRAWTLHLSFGALYLLAMNRPATAGLDGLGSVGYAKDQREAFRLQALYWKEMFEELAPEVPTTEFGEAARSYPVRNRFTW